MFTFAIYIRMLIEAYQFMLLSCISEISLSKTSSSSKTASLIFAFATLLLCLVIVAVGIFHFRNQKHQCFSEYESGTKDAKIHRIFTTIFLIRKIVLVAWVVSSESLPPAYIALFATVVQVIYTVWLLTKFPFKEVQNNLIEVINEITFTLL